MSAVLGFEAGPERVWIDEPGSHCLSASCKEALLSALHGLRPRKGARLVLLGVDVGSLGEAERAALLRRVGFVPANGGLMSSLNAWENISLPVAYHAPRTLSAALADVQRLLGELGGVDEDLLGKLPEHMTLYERRLAAYLRALLESPDLLVVESIAAGLGPTKRRRASRFGELYRQRCPNGTFVQFGE
jgi:ABC-type lipoprotein export system ATPase subunit